MGVSLFRRELVSTLLGSHRVQRVRVGVASEGVGTNAPCDEWCRECKTKHVALGCGCAGEGHNDDVFWGGQMSKETEGV